MSCIAGLFSRRGEKHDPRQLEQMLLTMKRRAPDGEQLLCDGPLAFGHLWLRTGRSGAEGPSPISLDGKTWIVADARIDGRPDLIRKLRAAGRQVTDNEPHAALILHAFRAFGERFLDHLIGDFSFALWDPASGSLVCARDHFGVRPFYYVDIDGLFGFASDADALLAIPQVSRALDETSVADFLLFGTLQDADRSIYRAIRCLPAATSLTLTISQITARTYWQLPRDGETRYRKQADYVARFSELFDQAVADRLPDGNVALQLSGGLDSTSIAAVVSNRRQGVSHRATAYNVSCASLFGEDEEQRYAEAAASHLALPLVCQQIGDYSIHERADDALLNTAGPHLYPCLAAQYDLLLQVRDTGASVLLSGQGGDAVLAPSATYYPHLMRSGRLGKIAREIAHHVSHTHSVAGMGLRSALLRRRSTTAPPPPLPDWIDLDFAARVGLAARWAQGWETLRHGSDPHLQLTEAWLSRQFEALEVLKMPVVARYPFFDLRLVQFMLGLPNFMRSGKLILRESMRGKLPDTIRLRPKNPLTRDFIRSLVTNSNGQWLDRMDTDMEWPAPVRRGEYLTAFGQYCSGDENGSPWRGSLLLSGLAFRIWSRQKIQGAAFNER